MNNSSATAIVQTLNNQGVEFIEMRDLRSAMESFNEAFRLAKLVLNGNRQASEHCIQAQAIIVKKYETNYQKQCNNRTSSSTAKISADCESDNDCSRTVGPFAYLKPIPVVAAQQHDEATADEICSLKGMMVILTFNLAVTQHLNAYQRNERGEFFANRNSRLQKALGLYELCGALRLKAGHRPPATCWEFYHIMGVLNNIGIIQRELGNTKKANHSSERLFRMIVYYMAIYRGNNCEEKDGLQRDVRDGLMSNATSHLINFDIAAAA